MLKNSFFQDFTLTVMLKNSSHIIISHKWPSWITALLLFIWMMPTKCHKRLSSQRAENDETLKERTRSTLYAKSSTNAARPSRHANYYRHALTLAPLIECHYFSPKWMTSLICFYFVAFVQVINMKWLSFTKCSFNWCV